MMKTNLATLAGTAGLCLLAAGCPPEPDVVPDDHDPFAEKAECKEHCTSPPPADPWPYGQFLESVGDRWPTLVALTDGGTFRVTQALDAGIEIVGTYRFDADVEVLRLVPEQVVCTVCDVGEALEFSALQLPGPAEWTVDVSALDDKVIEATILGRSMALQTVPDFQFSEAIPTTDLLFSVDYPSGAFDEAITVCTLTGPNGILQLRASRVMGARAACPFSIPHAQIGDKAREVTVLVQNVKSMGAVQLATTATGAHPDFESDDFGEVPFAAAKVPLVAVDEPYEAILTYPLPPSPKL